MLLPRASRVADRRREVLPTGPLRLAMAGALVVPGNRNDRTAARVAQAIADGRIPGLVSGNPGA